MRITEKNPLRFLPRLFNESYILLLNTANQIMNERLLAYGVERKFSISPRERWVLMAADEKSLSQGTIARMLNINTNVMVAIVGRLEKRGFVKRKAHKNSSIREYVLQLTPKGKAVLKEIGKALDDIWLHAICPRSLNDLKWAATMARDIINDYYAKNERGPARRLAL